MNEAEAHLVQINTSLASLLPQASTNEELSEREAASKAQQLVEAAAGIQKALAAFAATAAPTLKGRLQQEVAALEAELQAAESLLTEVESKLQRWQGTCDRLQAAHATALTDGI